MSTNDEKKYDNRDVQKAVDFLYQVMSPGEINALKKAKEEAMERIELKDVFFHTTIAFLKCRRFASEFKDFCNDNREAIATRPEDVVFSFAFTVHDKHSFDQRKVAEYIESFLFVETTVRKREIDLAFLSVLFGRKSNYEYNIVLSIPYLAIEKLMALHDNKVNDAAIEAERQRELKSGRI